MPLYQNLASFMHERLNIEFTYKPMTHLSREAIFRHLSFKPREGTTIEVFHTKNYSMQYGNYLLMDVRKLDIEVSPEYFRNNNIYVVFLAYFKEHHFREITLDTSVSFNLLLLDLNYFDVSTDSLVVINDDTFAFECIEGLSRKIHVFHSKGCWSDLCRAATEFRRDLFEKYLVGSYYKGYLEKMPNLEDFLDTLRIDFNGEFKYSDETIGVCAEMTGNRELFISYQRISDKNSHCFTAEVLEKGTTKHYHQLPVDLQKKFRGSEDERNRIRVIIDNDSYKRVKWVVRRVY